MSNNMKETENSTVPLKVVIDECEFYKKLDAYYVEKPNKQPPLKEKMECLKKEVMHAKEKRETKTRREYHLLKSYNILTLGNTSHLIKKSGDDKDIEYIVSYEDLYNSIYDCHVNKTGHGGRVKMEKYFSRKFSIPRPAITIFLSCCLSCNTKKSSSRKIVVRPILSTDFGERGQVDLIDFQSNPDRDFKWILNYQDHATKFVVLRPLKSKRAEEVAAELLQIFLFIGAPKILQSDNGREFVNKVIRDLRGMWPESIILNGRPRHPQSQGSIERSNQDVENILRAWMTDTGSQQWSVGLNFVQWQKNSSYHRIIGRSPYKAVYGFEPKLGLASSNIPLAIAQTLDTEEDLIEIQQLDDDDDKGIRSKGNHENGSDNDDAVVDVAKEVAHGNASIATTEDDENVCCVCSEVINDQELKCELCSNPFHNSCKPTSTSKDLRQLCNLCFHEDNIHEIREDSRKRMKTAGDKMLMVPKSRFPKVSVGECVLLAVPKVDRGPADPQNLVCVITKEGNGVYQVGCESGVIKGWFGVESLKKAGSAFLNETQIDYTKELSVREAVKKSSGGQGFFKCSCKPSVKQCTTKKCICKKEGKLCNSRCHNSMPCVNK